MEALNYIFNTIDYVFLNPYFYVDIQDFRKIIGILSEYELVISIYQTDIELEIRGIPIKFKYVNKTRTIIGIDLREYNIYKLKLNSFEHYCVKYKTVTAVECKELINSEHVKLCKSGLYSSYESISGKLYKMSDYRRMCKNKPRKLIHIIQNYSEKLDPERCIILDLMNYTESDIAEVMESEAYKKIQHYEVSAPNDDFVLPLLSQINTKKLVICDGPNKLNLTCVFANPHIKKYIIHCQWYADINVFYDNCRIKELKSTLTIENCTEIAEILFRNRAKCVQIKSARST